ncbi:hypothetical protein N9341_00015 [Candidatus Pelagibacter sp.]|nr:hypothetical protein [Candidatus Pelagibacter sp.]
MKAKFKDSLKNITLILISTIISIYIVEVFYSVYKVSSLRANKLSNEGRSKFDEFLALKKNYEKLTVSTAPFFLLSQKKNLTKEIFPLSGISNVLTIDCNESGYFSKYFSDRYGFNNEDEIWDKEVEVLLIGDSFTHGACVNRPHTFTGNFNLKFNTLSLGYAGNGPLLELGIIKEYIKIINPKKVIWIFSEDNDLDDIKIEFDHQILRKYVLEKNFLQNLKEKQNIVNDLQNKIVDQEFYNHFDKNNRIIDFKNLKLSNILYLKNLKNLIRYKFKINISKGKEFDDEIYELFNNVIFEANRVVKKNNAELYFVFLPQYPGKLSNLGQRFKSYQKIINIVSKQKIKVIDLHKLIFEKLDDPKSFFPGRVNGHYTKYGYKVASEVILENILK